MIKIFPLNLALLLNQDSNCSLSLSLSFIKFRPNNDLNALKNSKKHCYRIYITRSDQLERLSSSIIDVSRSKRSHPP